MASTSWFSRMMGTALTLDNLENVLVMELQDLYSAEDQLIAALPMMADAAHSADLKSAFQTHLEETRGHKARLEQIFKMMNRDSGSEHCEAMAGLVAEGNELMALDGDPEVKDAALIAAAQRVEHYEIAGYGCARTFARRLGLQQVAQLLQETLDEEANADKILTHVAESFVNPVAAQA